MSNSNPVVELSELCAFVRVPYVKNFEKQGKLFQCIITILERQITSDLCQSQKEAEQNAACKILSILPAHKIEDSTINQRGSAHEICFQASVQLPDKVLYSDWIKKKKEAKRDVLHKLVQIYFSETSKEEIGENLVNLAGTEFYSVDQEKETNKIQNFIRTWQTSSLKKIKQRIGPLPDTDQVLLDGMLTSAFIHSSFSHSEDIQEALEQLGLPYSNYERLEFFGDSILGFVASKLLFKENPTDTPHDLTTKKAFMVREDACCGYLKKLQLDSYVIQRDVLKTPSARIMCDVFEAVIGALYCVYEDEAQPIIERLLK